MGMYQGWRRAANRGHPGRAAHPREGGVAPRRPQARRPALSDAADGEPRLNSKLVFDMIMDDAVLMRHVVGRRRLKLLFLNYELAYLGR